MPKSNDRTITTNLLISLFFSLVSLAGACPLSGQTVSGCGENPVQFSQDFLRAVYPELSEKGKYMYISAGGPFTSSWNILREFSVNVKQYPDDAKPSGIIEPNAKAHEFHNDVLAAGFFMCASSGTPSKSAIYKFAGGGTLTGRVAWEAFRNSVDAHPEWTDKEMLKAMNAAGAKYGPDKKEEFLKQLNLSALEPFLGKVRVLELDFHVRDYPDKDHIPELSWVMRIESQPSSEVKQIYSLFFEPFRGKVYLISR